MSEPIKKPERKPESYRPSEKPEIIGLFENRTTKVVTEGNLTYIDGVPAIGWDIPWRDCTFSGCMTLLLNALGTNVTYERVMGLTGSCYRANMANGWDPASSIVDLTYYHMKVGVGTGNNINRVYGMDSYTVDDHAERDEAARKSIDEGFPVLSLGSRGAPEWGILLGYEKTEEGVKYFGRSYFDGDTPENEMFTENRYALASLFADYHQFYDKFCEPTPALDALKNSLETCLKIYAPHERIGYGAYDMMIKGFAENEYKSTWDTEGSVCNIMCNLIDARRAAHIYLDESAGMLAGENKLRLLAVSSMYKDMFDTLQGVIPYDTLRHDFDQNALSEETRGNMILALQKCKALEYQAHEAVAEILEHWEG